MVGPEEADKIVTDRSNGITFRLQRDVSGFRAYLLPTSRPQPGRTKCQSLAIGVKKEGKGIRAKEFS